MKAPWENIFKYDDDQPRADDGKWTDGGGNSGESRHADRESRAKPSIVFTEANRAPKTRAASSGRLSPEDKKTGGQILQWAKTRYGDVAKGPDGLKIHRSGRNKYTFESKRVFDGKKKEVDYSGLRHWLTEHFKRGSK